MCLLDCATHAMSNTCVCIYVYVCVCIYTHIHIYIHIHTYLCLAFSDLLSSINNYVNMYAKNKQFVVQLTEKQMYCKCKYFI